MRIVSIQVIKYYNRKLLIRFLCHRKAEDILYDDEHLPTLPLAPKLFWYPYSKEAGEEIEAFHKKALENN